MKRSGIQRGTSQLKRTGRISIEPGKSWANPARQSNHAGRPPKPVDEPLITEKYGAGRSIQSLAREFHINGDRVKKIVEANGGNIRKACRPKKETTATSENNGRAGVYRRSRGFCEPNIQPICTGRGEEWQHRLARSQGGTWDVPNGLHVCGACHDYIHAHPLESYTNGWSVRRKGNPAERQVLRRSKWVYLTAAGGMEPASPPESAGTPEPFEEAS